MFNPCNKNIKRTAKAGFCSAFGRVDDETSVDYLSPGVDYDKTSALNTMKQKTYKICQSCAMPLKHDPQGGGTEADGTKSPMYCSYCYQAGKFTGDFRTAKEMQEFCL